MGHKFVQVLKVAFISLAVLGGILYAALFVFFTFFNHAIIYLKNGTQENIAEAHIELTEDEAVSFGSLAPGGVSWIKISNPGEGDRSKINVRFESGKTLSVDTPIYFAILVDRDFLLVTPDDVVNAGADEGRGWINESGG